MNAAAPTPADIEAALKAGDPGRAAMLTQAAMNAGLRAPIIVRMVAEALANQGRASDAMRLLQHGLAVMPGDPWLMVGVGAQHLAMLRNDEARHVFEAAVKAHPDAAEPHFALGKARALAGDVAGARASLERAIELAPDYVEARAAFANLLARGGDGAAARTHAEHALRLAPQNSEAALAYAVADVNDGDFGAAEARLRDVLRDPATDLATRALATSLLADALHGQGKAGAAFLNYEAASALTRRQQPASFATASRAYVDNLERLRAAFETTETSAWSGAPSTGAEDDAAPQAHVFLVGFPRSGTTLLEQVLAAHPKVVTLEEQPALAMGEEAYLEDPAGLAALAGLDATKASALRADYWRVVRATGVEPRGRVFIDKLPLNTTNLPLIAKLFPRAKILFARRDPRDVVLSCFRRTFLINRATFAMLSLAGAAELYDRILALKTAYDLKLPLVRHEVRYERLVETFEAEARAVLTFLDLDWDEGMNDFAAKAATRAVNTPSAAQVRKGLYRDGAGQWRAYRDQMAVVMPVLTPWIAAAGYDPE